MKIENFFHILLQATTDIIKMDFNNFKTVQNKCPTDMRRYIGKFFDKEKINTTFSRLNSDSFLEYHLKELPQPTLIQLFVKALYNKLYYFDEKRIRFGIGHSGKDSKHLFNYCEFPSPLQQFIKINLDSIYYGYSISGFTHHSHYTAPLPQYVFKTYKYQEFTMQYVPIEGHENLTDNIPINQFTKLIRLFSRLGIQDNYRSNYYAKYNLTKEKRNKIDKILYDFTVLLQFLGNKYRKINRENKEKTQKDKLEAKEKAKKDKLEAKEKAQKDKLEAKEKAKKEKLEAKEKAQKDKLEAKEKAKKDKLEAKEKAKKDKLEAKEKAKKDKLEAKEKAKKDKLEAKEKAKKDKL